MLYSRKEIACLLLGVLFLIGMLLIIFSYPIGELFSRQFEGIGVYSIDVDEAKFRAVSSIVAGGILSLLSGESCRCCRGADCWIYFCAPRVKGPPRRKLSKRPGIPPKHHKNAGRAAT